MSGAAPAPRLAVVVPTLDEEAHLGELVSSLRAASQPPDEILVVDGGSRDRTCELARELGVACLEAPRGRGLQLARGAAGISSELVLFLHADMRVAPDALRALRAAYEDPHLIASGMRQRIDHPGRIYRCIEAVANWRVRRGWVYGDSGLAVRRSAYESSGGFRDQPLFEDLDLSRRLRRQGRVGLVDDAELSVSARRWEREGALRRTLLNWTLTAAWIVGVAPERLVRYYPSQPSATGGS